MRFIISKKTGGAYQFHLKDSDNKPLLWSPRFATITECRDGIRSLRQFVQSKAKFDEWQTDSGRYVFHLRSNDGHLLAMSAPFGSKIECIRRIVCIQNNLETALEEDLTF